MIINGWTHLLDVLPTLTEQELLETINFEAVMYRRNYILERLHQRYTRLRAKREREQLFNGVPLL